MFTKISEEMKYKKNTKSLLQNYNKKIYIYMSTIMSTDYNALVNYSSSLATVSKLVS